MALADQAGADHADANRSHRSGFLRAIVQAVKKSLAMTAGSAGTSGAKRHPLQDVAAHVDAGRDLGQHHAVAASARTPRAR